MGLLRRPPDLEVVRGPAQFMAEILDVRDLAHEFSADGPQLFSPDIPVISSPSGEFGENGPQHADESTTQGKPCGRQPSATSSVR
jgi:hypothetical protein